jgi:hypothetical protein
MKNTGWQFVVLFAALSVACGETTGDAPGTSGGAGGTAGGTATGGVSHGGMGGQTVRLPPPQTDCVVAQHADQCCSASVAVPAAALAADPCLVPYGLAYAPAVTAVCPAAERCLALNCAFPPPPSRMAAMVGGACAFVNECTTAADCTTGTILTGCCSCPGVLPKGLDRANPCVSPPGPPSGLLCIRDCGPVSCGACPSPNPVANCLPLISGYRTCTDSAPSG